jgi:hypothetical protein
MSEVVTFKLINGTDIIGKLNTDADARKGFEHIPNAIILDDAVHIGIQVFKGDDGQAKAQVSFDPVTIPVAGQGASRIALNPATVSFQYPIDGVYENGYLQATTLIQLPPGGGGKLIV